MFSLANSLAGLGACGVFINSNAMARVDFDRQTPNVNLNRNSLCGRFISVSGPRGTVTVRVVDRYYDCKSVSAPVIRSMLIVNCLDIFYRVIWISVQQHSKEYLVLWYIEENKVQQNLQINFKELNEFVTNMYVLILISK